MINEETTQQVVACVVAAAWPSRIILFGSYGRITAFDILKRDPAAHVSMVNFHA